MFLQEARVAARIHHPNVAEIYDVGLEAGSYYIALECVHGEDLRRLVRQAGAEGRTLPVPLAVRILGDASIVDVGLELGWERKQGAVLASRMTITATTLLPGRGRFPCRVAVGTLHPSSGSSSQVTGTVRFEFGEGCEIHGTALVSAPAN